MIAVAVFVFLWGGHCQSTGSEVLLHQLPPDTSLEGVWQDIQWGDLLTLRKKKGILNVATVIDSQSTEEFTVHSSVWNGSSLAFQYKIPSKDTTIIASIDRLEDGQLAGNWRLDDNTNAGEFRYKKIMDIAPENKPVDAASAAGQPVARVYRVRNDAVVIASGNMSRIRMHDRLYIMLHGQKVYLRVFFPMMTIARCSLDKGAEHARDRIAEGMPVYK